MTIHSDKNLYPGINAHLNSFLQQPDGGWEAFHARHIADIGHELDNRLPAQYYIMLEKSLQLFAFDVIADMPSGKASRTIPDVTVYQMQRTSAETGLLSSSLNAPVMTFPVVETFEEEYDLTSVVIYRIDDGKIPGVPVTRIKLLSPANKPPGTHYPHYLSKRQETLMSGMCLVEIDYLHETRPFLRQVPSYLDRQANAYPYTIIVSDPRPTVTEGQAQVYGIGVDSSLPILDIPLTDKDTVQFDFGAVYNFTFESMRIFRILVDYEQTPVNFDRYNAADQERIRQRMATIKANL